MKLKKDDGLDGDNEVETTLPSHLCAFIMSNIERNMKHFIKKSTDSIVIVYITEIPIACI